VLAAVTVVAGVCAAIAIYQWSARDLFLNPELFDSNQLHVYFRANSLFFDPNILGRYLALAITALGAYIAWSRGRRELALAALAAGLCLVGLAFSYSITSFAAVLAGLGIVALLRWGWRGAAAAGALGLAGLAGLAIAGGTPTSDIQDYRSIDSGRESLLEGGVDLFEREPFAGWGSGAFGQAFYEEIEPARSTISHSEPVTVAAEQGLVGLAVYGALVVTALVVLFDGARGTLARAAVAACFVAMLVHSLGYAGFAIDPVTWALLGLGVALRRGPPDGSGTMPP
jgi:O-antigen ligase